MPFPIQLDINLHAHEFDDVHPLNFFIMYHNIYIINNLFPWGEYHVMGLRYIQWKFIAA